MPVPPDFDRTALASSIGTLDRYQLIARVSSAVVCGWFDEYFDAQSAGDSDRTDAAAAALATSHDWAMLQEIDSQGGWSDEVWQSADAVNGGQGVMTGGGPVPPTRDILQSSLGCMFDTTG